MFATDGLLGVVRADHDNVRVLGRPFGEMRRRAIAADIAQGF